MAGKLRGAAGTVLAVFCTVAGWVILSNPPRYSEGPTYSREVHLDFTRPELWIGVVLLTAGVSYFVLKFESKLTR